MIKAEPRAGPTAVTAYSCVAKTAGRLSRQAIGGTHIYLWHMVHLWTACGGPRIAGASAPAMWSINRVRICALVCDMCDAPINVSAYDR
jgi:hypothetical protein